MILWFCDSMELSLRICHLCSAPLSLRTVSQGVLLTNSLKIWKFAFLKFRVLTIFLTFPISLRTVNSTYLPPIMMSLMSLLALVSIRSSTASPPLEVSITWLKTLSSMHCRNLWDCQRSPCYFSSRCWGGWSPPLGRETVSAEPPGAGVRRLCQ